uniref:Uncharacterized protein n=1 Tax=Knipowitschia caucasica TaxID=637954 RepID=A0AAV2K7U0_KNICA
MAAIMVVASAQNTRLVQSQGEGPCILLYPSGDNDFVADGSVRSALLAVTVTEGGSDFAEGGGGDDCGSG